MITLASQLELALGTVTGQRKPSLLPVARGDGCGRGLKEVLEPPTPRHNAYWQHSLSPWVLWDLNQILSVGTSGQARGETGSDS